MSECAKRTREKKIFDLAETLKNASAEQKTFMKLISPLFSAITYTVVTNYKSSFFLFLQNEQESIK